MQIIDVIIVAAAAVLVVLAIRSALRAARQGGCSDRPDCHGCAKDANFVAEAETSDEGRCES